MNEEIVFFTINKSLTHYKFVFIILSAGGHISWISERDKKYRWRRNRSTEWVSSAESLMRDEEKSDSEKQQMHRRSEEYRESERE